MAEKTDRKLCKSVSRADLMKEVAVLLSTDEEVTDKRKGHTDRVRLLRGMGGKKGGTQQIVTLLAGGFSTSISKAANTAAVITLTASSFADWSAYVGLYDEVTLISGEIWANYDSTGMASSNAASCAFAWDGADGATPTTSSDLICYRDHYGPFIVPTGGSLTGTGTSFPMAQGSISGFYHMNFAPTKMGSGPLSRRPELSVNAVTPINVWMSVNTGSINFGYLKVFLNNPNAANAGSFGVVCRVKLGFRLRNG